MQQELQLLVFHKPVGVLVLELVVLKSALIECSPEGFPTNADSTPNASLFHGAPPSQKYDTPTPTHQQPYKYPPLPWS